GRRRRGDVVDFGDIGIGGAVVRRNGKDGTIANRGFSFSHWNSPMMEGSSACPTARRMGATLGREAPGDFEIAAVREPVLGFHLAKTGALRGLKAAHELVALKGAAEPRQAGLESFGNGARLGGG